jgi:hypothetical protein
LGQGLTDRGVFPTNGPSVLMAQSTCSRRPARGFCKFADESFRAACSRYLEAKMTVYRAHIVGLHGRSIGVVQLDCIDDESAIKSARRLVDSHDVELWQMDRPVARLDAWSKPMCKK